MSRAAIRIENLGKRYVVDHERKARGGGYRTLRESIMDLAAMPLRRMRGEVGMAHEEFWALKDVSFDVQPGEVVGIIGRNGAGKSTLLKILSQITKPTKGRVELNGRVGSLLEVGTGFHPELTGRENIYLNGSILGMRKAEIERRFDEIVAFAEIEQFLDTPVKRYSSGMYVRLAFAVAAHLEPEILIIDEVLAVGDAAFQKKCIGRIDEVAKHGRTVLFVSHNSFAIRKLCQRGIYFENGTPVLDGDVDVAVNRYLEGGSECHSEWTRPSSLHLAGDKVDLFRVSLFGDSGKLSSSMDFRSDLCVSFTYRVNVPVSGLRLGVLVTTADGTIVFGSANYYDTIKDTRAIGFYTTTCVLPGHTLNAGRYQITVGADTGPGTSQLFLHDNCLQVDVEDNELERARSERPPGIVRPKLVWNSSPDYQNT